MFHLIRFADADSLPAGHDFLVAHSDQGFVVFVRADRVTEAVLEDAWDAYRAAWRSLPVEPVGAPLMMPDLTAAPIPFEMLACVA